MSEPILQLIDICKEYYGNQVLKKVNLSVYPGEVHALVGENGAGKSTIIKILMGVYSRTSGEIFIDGEPVDFKSPLQAEKYGLGAVYQDVNLAKDLTVAENFYMGQPCFPAQWMHHRNPAILLHLFSVFSPFYIHRPDFRLLPRIF